MSRKIATFELTSGIDRGRYSDLVDSGVAVLESNTFFGIGGSEEGPEPMIYRVIEYRDRGPEERVQEEIYRPPVA
jgi:hypothetical protein